MDDDPRMAKRHERATMERLLRRRRRDGLTFRELSEDSGVPMPTLAWWSRKLEREDEGRAVASALVPVEVVEQVEERGQPLDSVIEIVVRDEVRLLVPPTASDAHLRRVLRVLAAC